MPNGGYCLCVFWLMKGSCVFFLFSVSGRPLRLFKYDVSSSSISVHLPVSRFLAGTESVTSLLAFQI